MTTMPKRSSTSDTMRGHNEFGLSIEQSQALTKAAESWFAATTECQREMMGFVSKRLEKDSETMRQILGCKNVAEMTAIQSRWIGETLRDYNTEMTKLMSIYTRSVNGGGKGD